MDLAKPDPVLGTKKDMFDSTHYTGSFKICRCPECGFDWDNRGKTGRFYKYEKGWGFGLQLDKKVCPRCEEKRKI